MKIRMNLNIILALTFAVLVISTGVFLMGDLQEVGFTYAINYSSSVPSTYSLVGTEGVPSGTPLLIKQVYSPSSLGGVGANSTEITHNVTNASLSYNNNSNCYFAYQGTNSGSQFYLCSLVLCSGSSNVSRLYYSVAGSQHGWSNSTFPLTIQSGSSLKWTNGTFENDWLYYMSSPAINVSINFDETVSSISSNVDGVPYSFASSGSTVPIPYDFTSSTTVVTSFNVVLESGYIVDDVKVAGSGVSLVSIDSEANLFTLSINSDCSDDISINVTSSFGRSGMGNYIPDGYVLLPSDGSLVVNSDNTLFYLYKDGCQSLEPTFLSDAVTLVDASFIDGADVGLEYCCYSLPPYYDYSYYINDVYINGDMRYDPGGGANGEFKPISPPDISFNSTTSLDSLTLKKGAKWDNHPDLNEPLLNNNILYVPEESLTEAEPPSTDLYVAFDNGVYSVSCGDITWTVSESANDFVYDRTDRSYTFDVALNVGYRIVSVQYVFYGETDNILDASFNGSDFTITVPNGKTLALISILTEASVWRQPLTLIFDEGVEKVTCGDLTWMESGQVNDVIYDLTQGIPFVLSFEVIYKEGFEYLSYDLDATGGFTSSADGNIISISISLVDAVVNQISINSRQYGCWLTINWNLDIDCVKSNGVVWTQSGQSLFYNFNDSSLQYVFSIVPSEGFAIQDYLYTCNGEVIDVRRVGSLNSELRFTLPKGSYLTELTLTLEAYEVSDSDSNTNSTSGGIDGIGSIIKTLGVVMGLCLFGYIVLSGKKS